MKIRQLATAAAAAAALAASAGEPFHMNILPTTVGREEQTAADAKEYVRRTGCPVVLLSMSFHPEGFPAKAKADMLVESYRKTRKLLEGSDVRLGALIQSVMGHWARVDEKIEPWMRTVTIRGEVYRFCPLDPAFRAYIRDFVKRIAAEKPSFVLGDDDIHMYDECFCDLHRAEFNRRTGRSCGAEEFRKIVKASKVGDADYKAFFDLQRETVTGVCRLIREAIDEVDPSVPAGMCMSGIEYRFIGDLSRAIAAKGQRPLMRIANDAGYNEFDRETFAYLVRHTAEYEALYGRDFTLLDESDTFPQNLWNKSGSNLKTKLAVAFMCGVDGGLLWYTCAHRWGHPVTENYIRAFEDNLARFKTLKAFADESKAVGFTVPVQTNYPGWHFDGRGIGDFVPGIDWGGYMAANFGVPFRCSVSLDDGGVYAIAGAASVERFTDAEIRRLLSGRLLVDGDAVRALAARGFSRHLGLTVENRKINYVNERSADGKRYYPLRLIEEHPVPTLVESEGAEVLTWLEFQSYGGAPDRRRVAPATVYFENQLGGRVLSAAYTLDAGRGWSLQKFFRYCEPRKAWFVRALDLIGGGPAPFVSDDMRDIVALARERADGVRLLLLVNTNRDPLERPRVRVKCPFKEVDELAADGSFRPAGYTREGDVLVFDSPLACYGYTAFRFR
ncbi:MAG: hypothetical protein J6T01_04735 [Kiritimatiellae bacterium]|nr:hypothetical protein [Kiritimatiellia bacterium]